MTAAAAQKPRRTQDQRSRETRDKLLQATIDVLLERGYAGLTTAQVEARAGVSSGARVHHYRSKEDLVVAAMELIYERATQLGQTRAGDAGASAEPVAALIEDCRSIYFGWPFLASVDVMIAARTDPGLEPRVNGVLHTFHSTMKATWIKALMSAGYSAARAEIVFSMTLNLMRGMAINKVWQNNQGEYDLIISEWRKQVKPDSDAARA